MHRSRWFSRVLFIILAFLLAANLYVIYSEEILHVHHRFAWRFYFDRRLNFPFYFSITLLLIILFLTLRISKHTGAQPAARFWKILAIVFILFTADESFNLHHKFKMKTFGTIASYDQASLTHYLWVIPYFVVFGVLMFLLWKESVHLPILLKSRLAVAAVVFLLGAVVMEFAGTYYAVATRQADIYILLIKATEGLLQMAGSILFIRALSRHLRTLVEHQTSH
jgi:hypothetical protein